MLTHFSVEWTTTQIDKRGAHAPQEAVYGAERVIGVLVVVHPVTSAQRDVNTTHERATCLQTARHVRQDIKA